MCYDVEKLDEQYNRKVLAVDVFLLIPIAILILAVGIIVKIFKRN